MRGWISFRTAKSLFDTRPIFHKTDATICGHVFCSFLVLGAARRALSSHGQRRRDRRVGRYSARSQCAERNRDYLQWQDLRGAQQRRRRRRQGLHNASGSDCPTPCARSTLRRRSLTRVPEHRRLESRRTLACSAKAFHVPDNSLTSCAVGKARLLSGVRIPLSNCRFQLVAARAIYGGNDVGRSTLVSKDRLGRFSGHTGRSESER